MQFEKGLHCVLFKQHFLDTSYVVKWDEGPLIDATNVVKYLVCLWEIPSSTQQILVFWSPTSTTHALATPWPNTAHTDSCKTMFHFQQSRWNHVNCRYRIINPLPSPLSRQFQQVTLILFCFPQKIGFDISCKLSPQETICQNVKAYLLGRIKHQNVICWNFYPASKH